MIPLNQLIENGVYIIHARNSIIGIWRGKNKAFVIRRSKFSSSYLYEELYLDNEYPQGTAKPLRYLGMETPHNSINLDKLYMLSEKYNAEY